MTFVLWPNHSLSFTPPFVSAHPVGVTRSTIGCLLSSLGFAVYYLSETPNYYPRLWYSCWTRVETWCGKFVNCNWHPSFRNPKHHVVCTTACLRGIWRCWVWMHQRDDLLKFTITAVTELWISQTFFFRLIFLILFVLSFCSQQIPSCNQVARNCWIQSVVFFFVN